MPLQLPLNSDLRKKADASRKTRGGVLVKLGRGVSGRKRQAAWSHWIEETRGWLDTERMVNKVLL